MIWLSLFFGCEEPETSTPIAEPVLETEISTIEPAWSVEEMLQELDVLMTYGMPNPFPIRDLYLSLYDEGATPACPGTNFNFDGSEVDNAGCSTSDDYFYAGLGEVRLEDGQFDLHCDCRIVTPDGRKFQGAGNVAIIDDGGNRLLDVRGSFLQAGFEDGTPWLEAKPSVSLSMLTGDDATFLNGGYTIHNRSIYMENFLFGTCDDREGTVFFRDPSGGWWSWTAQASCTQGIVSFQGKDYGMHSWDSTQLDAEISQILELE